MKSQPELQATARGSEASHAVDPPRAEAFEVRLRALEALWPIVGAADFDVRRMATLRPIIEQAVAEARGAGLLPEQFILLVKRGRLRIRCHGDDAARRVDGLVSAMVTMSIEAYFRGER